MTNAINQEMRNALAVENSVGVTNPETSTPTIAESVFEPINQRINYSTNECINEQINEWIHQLMVSTINKAMRNASSVVDSSGVANPEASTPTISKPTAELINQIINHSTNN